MDSADLEMLRNAAQSATSGAVIEISPQLRQAQIEDRQYRLIEGVVADEAAMSILKSIASVGGKDMYLLSEEFTKESARSSEQDYLNWIRLIKLLQAELIDVSGSRVACTLNGLKLGSSSQLPPKPGSEGELFSEATLVELVEHQRELEESVIKEPLTMFILGAIAKEGGVNFPRFSEALARDSAWDNQPPFQNWVRVGRLTQAGFIDISESRVACTLAGQRLGNRYNELRDQAKANQKGSQS